MCAARVVEQRGNEPRVIEDCVNAVLAQRCLGNTSGISAGVANQLHRELRIIPRER
jgi:hypothetical protein